MWHISINVVWHYHSQIMQAKYLICQLPLETFFQKCQSKFESGQVEGSFLIRTMYLDLKFYSNLDLNYISVCEHYTNKLIIIVYLKRSLFIYSIHIKCKQSHKTKISVVNG